MAKFNMSIIALGLSGELKGDGIAVNALWPRTTIATAAVQEPARRRRPDARSRTPEIMGDAAHVIFTQDAKTFTGRFCIDDTLLYEHGVRDFEKYRVDPSLELAPDFFVPDSMPPPPGVTLAARMRKRLSSRSPLLAARGSGAEGQRHRRSKRLPLIPALAAQSSGE